MNTLDGAQCRAPVTSARVRQRVREHRVRLAAPELRIAAH